MTQYMKAACFTDIHFGAKSNSEQHNQDCVEYVQWFIKNAKANQADHIVFLGDWYECRSAINVSTLNYSHKAASLLNEMGLPVFFIIGNHDLYQRHTRDVYAPITFNEFSNFRLITTPTIVPEIGKGGAVLSPFLFSEEYPSLMEYLKYDTWFGHFEFKDFVITGHSMKMQHGPDPTMFTGPTHIFSGHFHKRQTLRNITYIGNTFPTSFGDVNDFDRGMMIYEHDSNTPTFIDWEDCPKYVQQPWSLMKLLDFSLPPNSRVKIVLDQDVTYDDLTVLRDEIVEKNKLRELSFVEPDDEAVITDTETNVGDQLSGATIAAVTTVEQMVVEMLMDIKDDKVSNDTLVRIYKQL